MDISLPTQTVTDLTNEANRRNANLQPGESPHTVESIAAVLLASAAESYTKTAQDAYVRDLYERIKAADAATRTEIFTAAEEALA